MTQTAKRKKWIDVLRLLRKGVQHIFLHNGGFKLIAILISVALWAGLISQDPNVTRNKVFQNVNITVQGSDSDELHISKGRIVTSDLEELLKGVTVTASVPQLQFESAEASAYNLHIDLSDIRSTGEQELRIRSDNSQEYGEVINITPASVKVRVEEYFTSTKVPITVRTEGEAPEGWYITQPTVTPLTVSVSGPISIVKEVSRGIATLDLNALKWEEETIPTSSKIKLYNLKSEMITSQLLTISSEQNKNDSVIITATMLPTRDYHMKDMVQIKGELQEGYEMVGEPVFSTEFITIAASEENLNMLEEMPAEQRADAILESRIVDISDLTETTVFKIKVKELDINKDKWVTKKPESGTTVRVTIEVAPVQEETTGNEEIQTENAQAEDVQNGDQQE